MLTMRYNGDIPDRREISLPPLLDEFRKALRDEIEVAKRNSSNSAIPLSNGQKISQAGGTFQYAFLVDSVLNMPDGSPGDLILPGRPPLEASIVSAEGLRLVLSVPVDLGQFVPQARLQSNLTILMRKLIERIEANASSDNPSAQRMLGRANVSGEPKQIDGQLKLNEAQLRAVESALGRDLTFIWGPPGTGKTHTIGTITEQLYKEHRSVLIVSHTNIAVDQAVHHVAGTIPEELEQGVLLRLGEVRDEKLKADFPDVLLKRQVERRSKQLAARRDELEAKKLLLSERLNLVENDIAIIEWVINAQSDIDLARDSSLSLAVKEAELAGLAASLSAVSDRVPDLQRLKRFAEQAIDCKRTLRENEYHAGESRHVIAALSDLISRLVCQVNHCEERVDIAQRILPLRKELSQYDPVAEQRRRIMLFEEELGSLKGRINDKQNELGAAQALLGQTNSTGAMMRIWKRLPKPEHQQEVVNDINQRLIALNHDLSETETKYRESRAVLNRTIELQNEIQPYKDIGDYFAELSEFKKVQKDLDNDRKNLTSFNNNLRLQEKENQQLQDRIRTLLSELNGNAEATLVRITGELSEIDTLANLVKSSRAETMAIRHELTTALRHMVECLSLWDLIQVKPSAVEPMLEVVITAHSSAAAKYEGVQLAELSGRASSLRSEIASISNDIRQIDEKLSQVEKVLIAEASIIGATLTKTYLSDDIQGRKFDTVILDEASMAPIPALWVAALVAEKNVIIVGDFKQLPPIVLSSNELTKKWLGRDIFDISGMRLKWESHESPSYFIPLAEQLRMSPQITDIANLFYGNLLKSSPSNRQQKELEKWQSWYNSGWKYDSPVLLVDTGCLNAWVTSVFKSGNSSRLNFLSATVTVDLAEQLLRSDRPPLKEGDAHRILIISPYRAHAKLVGVLLRENKDIDHEVIAGTAHSFQGSEAHVVIFDLVADEPHFRVNLFIPELDDQLKCLLNVSMTRARYRLIIVGDFDYCQSHAKKAFLGRELLPFLLKKYPRIDALQLVPEGLASRAAKAQMTMLGGAIEPDSSRIVVTQADFFRILSADFERARSVVVIYSPFLTQDRVSFLLPQLQAAASRGVRLYVVTKAHAERTKTQLEQYRKLERLLSDIGIVVIHKLRMHEKLVFIDDDITWSGSLNPLSFSDTQEIMERRKSHSVLDDYFKILRLQELVSVHDKREAECPICGSEMIAAEGADEPYYWRCVNDDCYSRSIDQPYPTNGVLTCARCTAPVKFGYWGDYPHWRCSASIRHRQKIFKAHLRLPKMAALIPKSERKKVCKLLMIDDQVFLDDNNVRNKKRDFQQPLRAGLFDEAE